MPGVVQLGRPEPDGVLLLAGPRAVEADGLLEVAVALTRALVPHEAEAHALRMRVVGPDVSVEQGALNPHGFAQEDLVLQVVHRPVCTAVHCKDRDTRERERAEREMINDKIIWQGRRASDGADALFHVSTAGQTETLKLKPNHILTIKRQTRRINCGTKATTSFQLPAKHYSLED